LNDAGLLLGENVFNSEDLTFVLPPQSVATRAALARTMIASYKSVLRRGFQGFRGELTANGAACTNEAVLASGAVLYTEALQGLQKAGEVAASLHVAVADAQLGSSTQAALANARAFAGTELSRAAAAHTLLGGVKGIFGDVSQSLCASNGDGQEVQLAIDVIRDLAPPPSSVLAVSAELDGAGASALLDAFID